MVPRNIRKIPPWKIAQIISLFNRKIKEESWKGNQMLQDSFTVALNKAGLKRDFEPYDIKSGGARTYKSQLSCLGLIIETDENIYLSLAGQDIIDGNESPLKIL